MFGVADVVGLVGIDGALVSSINGSEADVDNSDCESSIYFEERTGSFSRSELRPEGN